MELESGATLPDVVLGYETWGTLNAEGSNAVLIEHALTGDTHVTRGASEEPGWWEELAGPGAPVDTDRYLRGLNQHPGRLLRLHGTRDAGARRTAVGVPVPAGNPAGHDHGRSPAGRRPGYRQLVRRPGRLAGRGTRARMGRHLPGAGSALRRHLRRARAAPPSRSPSRRPRPWRSGRIPTFRGGDYYGGPQPEAGLALARRIAHITYRSAAELDGRFGRNPQGAEAPLASGSVAGRGRYQVESYLDHQGSKLVRRFDANSYIAITEALMSHDVCRGRGTLSESLAAATAKFLIAAVKSDRLYFPSQSLELAEALPGGAIVHMIDSPIGHDGFLTEIGQLSDQLRGHFFR